MRFAASRRWEMTTQSPKNKGQCSTVGPAQPKRKLLPTGCEGFPCDSNSECSARLSGLLTYIVLSCTPSPLSSRRQLAPPAPSPLVHAAAALPVAACECCRRRPYFVSRVSRPRYVLRCRRRRCHPATAATPVQHQRPPPARITGLARSPQVRALPAATTVLPHPLPHHTRLPQPPPRLPSLFPRRPREYRRRRRS
jgi:hypothetical protein